MASRRNTECPDITQPPDAHQRVAPGDIVRHADYPQWGRGYVLRAKRSSSDVFFQWGGRRKIDAGEPLEPSRASGVEAEFFSLCAGVSARSWSRGHHSVYAIELDRAVWKNRAFRERNPGGATGGCVYIGVTGLTPEERFERHRVGTQSGRFVRAHGLRLRLDLVEGVLAPAVPDCGLHGTEARRMVTGTGVRGMAELTRRDLFKASFSSS